jgi:hypothetical protein
VLSRIRHPSPAMVVACAALAVALGGVGYAATVLPANSVGLVQLKANSVNSAKVLNGSLLKADFKPGQIPSGPAGAAGPAGPAGPAGAAGPAGPAGPAGAAAAKFWATLDTNGLLLKGSGVASTSHPSPGLNYVKFNSDINNCASVATIYGPGANYGMVAAQIQASDTLAVGTTNTAGAPTNQPISVAVFC